MIHDVLAHIGFIVGSHKLMKFTISLFGNVSGLLKNETNMFMNNLLLLLVYGKLHMD